MKLLLTLATALSLISCTAINPPAARGSVDHVVLVWLKRPGNPQDRQALRSTADELRSIHGVRSIDHGTALASERPIVDDSFDVGFVMRFDSAAALGNYEKDPLHVKKVKEVLKPLSSKILIYDIVH